LLRKGGADLSRKKEKNKKERKFIRGRRASKRTHDDDDPGRKAYEKLVGSERETMRGGKTWKKKGCFKTVKCSTGKKNNATDLELETFFRSSAKKADRGRCSQ